MKTVILNNSFLEQEHIERLKLLGEVEIFDKSNTEALIIERLNGADVAVADMFEAPLNSKVFANLPSVKFLTINSTGYDLVDLKAAADSGITVSHVPGFSTDSVAEHTIALIFATIRHIATGDKVMRQAPFQLDPANRDHDQYLGTNIRGKTIGIIGLGQIGKRVAELAEGLGMKVIGYNRTPTPTPGVSLVSLDELFKQSDVVSINSAPSPEQKHLINEESIGLMKPTAVIVNTARGSFINDADLARALSERRISGAGLDFVEQWSSDNPLLKLDNVVLTPHVGWFTQESLNNMANIIVANVEAFVAAKPINVAN